MLSGLAGLDVRAEPPLLRRPARWSEYPPFQRRDGEGDRDVGSGSQQLQRVDHELKVRPNNRPLNVVEHDERQFPPAQVLLIDDALIAGNHAVEPGFFSRRDEAPVGERVPSEGVSGLNFEAG